MNSKKRHEVEVLAAVIQRIANEVEAHDIIDVGAGQGYLAQVLSFEYQLSVIALDASSHHATVTNQRAERIKKHYQARMRKSHMGDHDINVPQTITHHICSDDSLASLSKVLSSSFSIRPENNRQQTLGGDRTDGSEGSSLVENFAAMNNGQTASCDTKGLAASLILAGLHACGDLSVTMIRVQKDGEASHQKLQKRTLKCMHSELHFRWNLLGHIGLFEQFLDRCWRHSCFLIGCFFFKSMMV
jgi:hypothetical protein